MELPLKNIPIILSGFAFGQHYLRRNQEGDMSLNINYQKREQIQFLVSEVML